ncbi:hypothetical protein [Streptomyces sp. ISL-100]|nr:hypothetical protein [Streptomyces sp. ISL-100]
MGAADVARIDAGVPPHAVVPMPFRAPEHIPRPRTRDVLRRRAG